ncbi:MAG TPA: hypothetical protein VJL33_03500 [Candidatus Bathyarchaeia archaeon]|nr:hypothetical protein [Candidatus Bathyarchaeia archaeon]
MGSKTSDDLGWLSYIVLGVWIVNAFLIVFLMTRVDSIVHGQLYAYGLQFSRNWADPYWASVNLIYVFMSVPTVLSTIVLGIVLVRNRKLNGKYIAKLKIRRQKVAVEEQKTKKEKAAVAEEVPVENAPQEPEEPEPLVEPYEPKMEVINEVEAKENNGLLISCPSCKKVFNRPLVMLDFSSGKTRLVNICPYCSHTLGEAADQKKDDENANVPATESS